RRNRAPRSDVTRALSREPINVAVAGRLRADLVAAYTLPSVSHWVGHSSFKTPAAHSNAHTSPALPLQNPPPASALVAFPAAPPSAPSAPPPPSSPPSPLRLPPRAR